MKSSMIWRSRSLGAGPLRARGRRRPYAPSPTCTGLPPFVTPSLCAIACRSKPQTAASTLPPTIRPASATPRCLPWQSRIPRRTQALRSAHSVPYLANTPPRRPRTLGGATPNHGRSSLMSAAATRAGLRGCRALRASLHARARTQPGALLNREFPMASMPRPTWCELHTDELVPCAVEGDAGTAGGPGRPDSASFAAWVTTNDIVRSQIDERILQATEQGCRLREETSNGSSVYIPATYLERAYVASHPNFHRCRHTQACPQRH